MTRALQWLVGLDRLHKRAILVGYDLLAMNLALWGAFSVRLGQWYLPQNWMVLLSAAIAFAAGILALQQLQIYRSVLRYFDLRLALRIFFGAAISAITWMIAVYFTRAPSGVTIEAGLVPRSSVLIYCGFLFVLLFMGRFAMSELLALVRSREGGGRLDGPAENIAIYGANAAGISLADAVRASGKYRLRVFVDDDPALRGQMAAGVPIISPEMLSRSGWQEELSEVFLAMPHASRTQRLNAISRLTELNFKVKTVPAPEEIVSGRFTISDVRPIDINDLLRREPVSPLIELLTRAADGKSILVTGAGGSIGSEICRQVLARRPRKLVLLDQSEYGLFTIEQELREALARTEGEEPPLLVPIVGSMLNATRVRTLLAAHGIDTIFHAAAYKHVPLLEGNEVVGVENNVFGTLAMVEAAFEAGIGRFTMVSTDKAVRPESVMGASKRIAELIVQAHAARSDCRTKFGIVRFGNVLDSSGSVVQRFRDQIRAGGPVTVTHEEITRFFMSIPEATQLVLQASAMAERGEVFVLDMGEPVKIVDLARNMIRLSGMSVRDGQNPNGDIEIAYVGLRPGEKLLEELFVGEDARDTAHPRIRMASERHLPLGELEFQLRALRDATVGCDAAEVRRVMRELIAPDLGDASGHPDTLRSSKVRLLRASGEG